MNLQSQESLLNGVFYCVHSYWDDNSWDQIQTQHAILGPKLQNLDMLGATGSALGIWHFLPDFRHLCPEFPRPILMLLYPFGQLPNVRGSHQVPAWRPLCHGWWQRALPLGPGGRSELTKRTGNGRNGRNGRETDESDEKRTKRTRNRRAAKTRVFPKDFQTDETDETDENRTRDFQVQGANGRGTDETDEKRTRNGRTAKSVVFPSIFKGTKRTGNGRVRTGPGNAKKKVRVHLGKKLFLEPPPCVPGGTGFPGAGVQTDGEFPGAGMQMSSGTSGCGDANGRKTDGTNGRTGHRQGRAHPPRTASESVPQEQILCDTLGPGRPSLGQGL